MTKEKWRDGYWFGNVKFKNGNFVEIDFMEFLETVVQMKFEIIRTDVSLVQPSSKDIDI